MRTFSTLDRLAVHLGDDPIDLGVDVGVDRERFVVGDLVVRERPGAERVAVEREQRGQVATALADHDGLGDEVVVPQVRLDLLGRDVLAAPR